MKSQLHRWVYLGVALGLAACGAASAATSPTTAATHSVPSSAAELTATSTTSTPGPAGTPNQPTAAPAPARLPPQTSAAEIRPPERRPELARLTNLLRFQVVGLDNAALGSISDFIINTCETYIVYFSVDPAPALKVAAGQRLVIPFEAVTINSGAIDAASKSIVLHLVPSQLTSAPAFPNPLPLFPNTWEQRVRDYWQREVRVGKLSTACAAGGGPPIYKIAYATQLLGAQLKDGNHVVLGTITEAILAPESGKLEFYVVNLQNSQGLVLVPLARTNIPTEALKPGATTELVLLASDGQLAGAPRLANAAAATDGSEQGAARGYWGS